MYFAITSKISIPSDLLCDTLYCKICIILYKREKEGKERKKKD